jgi:hypothetical protein
MMPPEKKTVSSDRNQMFRRNWHLAPQHVVFLPSGAVAYQQDVALRCGKVMKGEYDSGCVRPPANNPPPRLRDR